MKLWTLEYNEDDKINFPQVMYKGYKIDNTIKIKIIKELFRIFYLTHRDARNKIKDIEKNNKELPYEGLYALIFPPKTVEFQKEYLIELLNYFNMEIDNLL